MLETSWCQYLWKVWEKKNQSLLSSTLFIVLSLLVNELLSKYKCGKVQRVSKHNCIKKNTITHCYLIDMILKALFYWFIIDIIMCELAPFINIFKYQGYCQCKHIATLLLWVKTKKGYMHHIIRIYFSAWKTHPSIFKGRVSNIHSLPFVNTIFSLGHSSQLNAPEVS